MESLGNNHDENLAGIVFVMLALTRETASMPDIDSDGVYSDLPTLIADASWGVLEFTDDTAIFKGNPKRDAGGTVYKPTLSFKVPKLDPTLSAFVDKYVQAGFVMAIRERNGRTLLIGSPDQPARMSVKDIDTGDKVGDYNGVQIDLYAFSRYPARYCATTVDPPDGADRIKAYSLYSSTVARVLAVYNEDSEEGYFVDEYVMYNDTIVKCNTPTSGAYNPDHWDVITTGGSAAGIFHVDAATTDDYPLDGSDIDGITPIVGRNYLIRQQLDPNTNFIYVYEGGSVFTRNPEYDNLDIVNGSIILVNRGTTLRGGIFSIPIALTDLVTDDIFYQKYEPVAKSFAELLAIDNSAGGSQIKNGAEATDPQDFTTLIQVEGLISSSIGDANDYTDAEIAALKDSVPAGGDTLNKLYNLIYGRGNLVGDFDASSGALPTTGTGISGAITKGDYWDITVAGTLPSGVTPNRVVKVGDVLVAKANGSSTGSQFYTVEGNQDQATETVQGISKIVTQAIIQDETSTNDTDSVTAKKFWLGLVRFLALPWTWALKQTFTTAPRLSSMTASKMVAVDSNKDVIDLTDQILGSTLNGLTAKNTIADDDEVASTDGADTRKAKKTSWLNIWTNYIKGKADLLYGSLFVSFRTISATSDTLLSSDNNTVLRCNNSAGVAITVPLNSSVAISNGFRTVLRQSGTGAVSLVIPSGVTVNAPDAITTTGKQYDYLELIKQATDTWMVIVGSGSYYAAIVKPYIDSENKKFEFDLSFNGNTQLQQNYDVASQIDAISIGNGISQLFMKIGAGSEVDVSGASYPISISASSYVTWRCVYTTTTTIGSCLVKGKKV